MYNITFNLGMPRLWLPPKLLLIMRLIIIILTTCLMQVSAATFAQKLTYAKNGASLEEVFKEIRKQTGYNVFYSNKKIDDTRKIDVHFKDAELKDVLEVCVEKQSLEYTIDDKNIFIKPKDPTFLERLANRWASIDANGRVVDSENRPLPGASVKVKKTGKGVSTDKDGKFFLRGVEEGAVLLVSFIGYLPKEVNASANLGSVVLEQSLSKLDEIQVIAYGTTTQRLSTSNITSIRGEDIARQPVGNLLLGLQGRIPGMQLTQTSGVPGADVKVRVQGENSIRNGNEAFYVIDGIPYVPQNLYSGFIGAIPGTGSTLSYLNPSDVESIVVLKDADATAIYGSRAANGAILITTKKGKAGQTKIDLNAQSGWGRPSRMLDLMNTEQYIAMRKEAIKNAGETIGPTDYDVNGTWDANKYTNWQKKLLNNTANYTSLQATISGGSEGTQFLASGGYIKEGTVFSNQYSDTKGNLRINLNHTSKDKKFDFTISSNYLQDLNRLPIIDLAASAVTLAPNAPDLYNPDGSINWAPLPGKPNSATFDNPATALASKYEAKTNNLMSNSIIGYRILPGLAVKANLGYSRLETFEIATAPQSAFPPYVTRNLRAAKYATKIISSWIIEPQLTYTKSFSFGLFDALLGSSFQSTNKSVMAFRGTNYANDDQLLNPLAAGSITADYNTMRSLYRYNAVFGRLNYQAQGKYIVNLSIRRDGSSRFGSENLFHTFYSIGTAWIFSEERWFKDHQSFLSFGKLRFTYGTTGNDQIQDYQYLNLYTNYSSYVVVPYQQTIGLLPSGHSNPYLQWEETKKLNVGIDLGIMDNRLIINANYYRNRSSNQLLDYTLPFLTGFSTVLRNIPALVENSGFELVANYSPIQTKEFKWQLNLNATIPRNKLVAYPGLEESSAYSAYIIGKPINIAKVYEYAGVDEKTGYYQFKTVDGKLTSSPDQINDRTKTINLGQTLYGGLNNTFTYKNLEVSFLLQFVKQKAQNLNFGSYIPGLFNVNQPLNLLDRWQKIGDKKNIQQVISTFDSFDPFNAIVSSDAGYSDASYIRLKTASISYNLPERWLQKVKISKAQFFMQGQNLFVLTKLKQIDPETLSSTTLPPLRVISIGAQLTF
jgi:TonB-linked SusC/RagA family outer membrane protein